MPAPDIHTPLPDRSHESLRQSVVQALEDGAANATGVEDAYFLTDLLFDLLNDALNRLDALENPTP